MEILVLVEMKSSLPTGGQDGLGCSSNSSTCWQIWMLSDENIHNVLNWDKLNIILLYPCLYSFDDIKSGSCDVFVFICSSFCPMKIRHTGDTISLADMSTNSPTPKNLKHPTGEITEPFEVLLLTITFGRHFWSLLFDVKFGHHFRTTLLGVTFGRHFLT